MLKFGWAAGGAAVWSLFAGRKQLPAAAAGDHPSLTSYFHL